MAKMTFFVICLVFSVTLLLFCVPTPVQSIAPASSSNCKELNQFNCYSAKNEGYFCNSREPTHTETRWYYDKGTCRKFNYKGCNGNRNRFCSKETCMKRCY